MGEGFYSQVSTMEASSKVNCHWRFRPHVWGGWVDNPNNPTRLSAKINYCQNCSETKTKFA